MNLNFDIPTPPNCTKCPFGSLNKLGDGWIFTCCINRKLKMSVNQALEARHQSFPGKE